MTDPQRRVLDELVKDQSINDVCAALNRTYNTVDRHRSNLQAIAGVKTRTGLVRWAIRTGLVAA